MLDKSAKENGRVKLVEAETPNATCFFDSFFHKCDLRLFACFALLPLPPPPVRNGDGRHPRSAARVLLRAVEVHPVGVRVGDRRQVRSVYSHLDGGQ